MRGGPEADWWGVTLQVSLGMRMQHNEAVLDYHVQGPGFERQHHKQQRQRSVMLEVCMVVQACDPTRGRERSKFKVIHSYIAGFRVAWTRGDSPSQTNKTKIHFRLAEFVGQLRL